MVAPMNCPSCGHENREGAAFCSVCSASLAPEILLQLTILDNHGDRNGRVWNRVRRAISSGFQAPRRKERTP